VNRFLSIAAAFSAAQIDRNGPHPKTCPIAMNDPKRAERWSG